MALTDISVGDQSAKIQKQLEEMGGMLDIGLPDHPAAASVALGYRLRIAFIVASAAGLWLGLYEIARLAFGA